jgi:cytochrome c553
MIRLAEGKYLEDKLAYFRSFFLCIFIAYMSSAIAVDMPIGDATHGKSISQTCVACHGTDGKAVMPIYPNLSGQDQRYLFNSLQAFKQGASGPRNNPIMAGMVATLSDQDMADLAAYYSSQPATHSQADPALVERGRRIYLGGVAEDKVPACSGCHGPQGEGNRFAAFPALSGQNADYLVQQLTAFREGQRGGGYNDMMHSVTQEMSTDDMKAVSSYISGLH